MFGQAMVNNMRDEEKEQEITNKPSREFLKKFLFDKHFVEQAPAHVQSIFRKILKEQYKADDIVKSLRDELFISY